VASFQIKNLKEDCTSALTLLKGVKWPKPQQAQQAQQAPPQGPVGMGGVGGALNPAPAPAVGSQQPVLARQGSPLIALLMAALGAGKAYPARRLTLAACRCLSDLVVPRRSGSSGAGVAAVMQQLSANDAVGWTYLMTLLDSCDPAAFSPHNIYSELLPAVLAAVAGLLAAAREQAEAEQLQHKQQEVGGKKGQQKKQQEGQQGQQAQQQQQQQVPEQFMLQLAEVVPALLHDCCEGAIGMLNAGGNFNGGRNRDALLIAVTGMARSSELLAGKQSNSAAAGAAPASAVLSGNAGAFWV
jgi:hypothetical protein